jgi:uncharacterized membrane protein YdjX (TVP38/TMEM64 family)
MSRILRDRRFWLVALAIALVIGLRLAGLGDLLTLDSLRAHRSALTGFVASHGVLSAGLFVVGYAAAVGLSVPGAVILTIGGGFLFGAVLGTVLSVTGASIGATLVFMFARSLFGPDVLERFGDSAVKLGEAIKANAWSYLLVLRLVPLFPFFLVNLVPAFVGVSLPVFVFTTFLGIVPGTAVFATAGAGLGSVLDAGGDLQVSSILTPQVLAGLFGLAALSLASIPLKKRFSRPNG